MSAAVAATLAVILCLFPSAARGQVMVEKNLFSPDRKPPGLEGAAPQKAPEKKEAPPQPPRNIQIDGVFFHGSVKTAILRVGQQPGASGKKGPASPFVTVKENEEVSGYKVTKIEPLAITLEQGGNAYVLKLFGEGKVAAPAPQLPQPYTGPAPEAGEAAPAPGVAPAAPGAPPPPGALPAVSGAQAPQGAPGRPAAKPQQPQDGPAIGQESGILPDNFPPQEPEQAPVTGVAPGPGFVHGVPGGELSFPEAGSNQRPAPVRQRRLYQ